MISLAVAALVAAQPPAAAAQPQAPAAAIVPQSEQAAVLATVDKLFDAMRRRDPQAYAALFVPQGTSIRVGMDGTGTSRVRIRSNADDIAQFAAGKERWQERIWDAEVRVHGPIAMVWAPYDFHVDGKFSHCGVDLFELLKVDGKWLLSNASWTVQTTGCVPSPLGPIADLAAP